MARDTTPTRPFDIVPDEHEDVPAAHSGVITTAAEIARSARDALHDTPAEGEQTVTATATATATSASPKKPAKAKRPGWLALVVAFMGSGVVAPPAWEWISGGREVEAEIATLRGENTVMREAIATIQQRLDRGYVRDLDAAADGAIEYRELDSKVAAVWKLMSTVAVKIGVDPKEIPTLPETSDETQSRHEAAIRARSEAKRRAESLALERALSEGDRVSPP